MLHFWVRNFLLTFFFFFSFAGLAQEKADAPPWGYVDVISYEPASQSLRIQGWSWDQSLQKTFTQLRVLTNGETHLVDFNPIARPDVQKALNISGFNSGFDANIPLDKALPSGYHPVSVEVRANSGANWLKLPPDHSKVLVSEFSGVLDSIRYDRGSQQIEVSGWAFENKSAKTIDGVSISINGEVYKAEYLKQIIRKDVQNSLGIDLAEVGFLAYFKLNKGLSVGDYVVNAKVDFPGGHSYEIYSGSGKDLVLKVGKIKSRNIILLSLIVLFVICFYIFSSKKIANLDCLQGKERAVSVAVFLIFSALVALGISGSSLRVIPEITKIDFVEINGSDGHLFKLRGIRSDEWAVLTPSTLAQWNHQPQFPIVNDSLGVEGQNMGVIHMTGVPIWQLAAVGRMATWGYFFLPLQQALSWHWLFPFFACLIGLWYALNRVNAKATGLNLLLSLAFCVAPYAAGWSLWPLYAAFFPLAIFVLFTQALKNDSFLKNVLIGLALGVLGSGWVLVLYPPWQVTLGTLLLLLCVGWLLDNRGAWNFGFKQCAMLGVAFFSAVIILGSWWLDTEQAISIIRSTVYPGGRTAMQGADLVNIPWWPLRGYSNIETLTFDIGAVFQNTSVNFITNQSEISSYILFPLPILLLALFYCRNAVVGKWTLRILLVFVAFILVFAFYGIPLWMSKTMLWSYVTVARLDLVFALVSVILITLIAANQSTQPRIPVWLAVFAAAASAALVMLEFAVLPVGMLKADSWVLHLAMVMAAAMSAWWIMRGHLTPAILMVLMLHLLSTVGFNPLSIAPESVSLKEDTKQYFVKDGRNLRTLILGDGASDSMFIAAAGVPTVGGVFSYPHFSLWEKMDLAPEDFNAINRFQHLIFRVDSSIDKKYKVSNWSGDTVVVSVHPRDFDFSHASAELVIAKKSDAELLMQNPFLKEVGRKENWVWFAVQASSSEI